MSMTRVCESAVIVYYILCDFCGQVNPENMMATRGEVEQLEIEHRARHCSNCYKFDGHEDWCEAKSCK